MSFIFPIISSISIAITCGYILYNYFIKDDISKPDRGNTDRDKPDRGNTDRGNTDMGNTDMGNTTGIHLIIKDDTSNKNIPTLIMPTNTGYTQIPSCEDTSDDFDIITNADTENVDTENDG